MRSRIAAGAVASVAAGVAVLLAAGRALAAQATTTTAATARHPTNRSSPVFLVVLAVFGVLVLLLQQRNYRRVRETFDPTFRERDTGPPPPDEPPDEQPRG